MDRRTELLAAIFRTSLNGIIVVDETGAVVDFNPAAEAIFGYTRDQAIGQPIGDLIVPHHLRRAHRDGMARYIATGVPHVLNRRVEITALRASGEEFPVELAISEVRSDHGRHFAASLRDLSREKAMEAERDDYAARLEGFMEHAPIGMYLKDAAGRYILANPEFSKVFGRPLDDIIGRAAEDLLRPDEAAMIRAYDEKVLASGAPLAIEEFLDGRESYAWTLVVRFPLWSEAVREWRIGGFDIDITPLKSAAEEIRRSQAALHQNEKLAALGRLLAGVSHELNNPLAVVLAQAEMLAMETVGLPQSDRAARIRRAAERCARIVQTFLALAKQKPPQRTAIDLNALLDAVVDLLGYILRTGGVRVVRDFDPSLPRTQGDPDQLHQVLMNLALNAVQAMASLPEGEARELHLSTSVSADGSTLLCSVRDTGPGIPPDIAERVFEPFFSTKEVGQGTGLGLSYSRAIVEGHGGSLTLLHSERGAHLRMGVPLVSGESDNLGKARTPAPDSHRYSALIVDDEPDVAETLSDLLGHLGFSSTVSHGAGEALERLPDQAFDIIFVDLRMPGVDGEGFLARLERIDPRLVNRLAFMTGDVFSEASERTVRRTGRPVLTKPFDQAALRALVAEVMARDALGPTER